MNKHFTIVALLAFSGLAQAGNYATCLLDKLPGVENYGASVSAVRVCQSKYPGGLASVEQGAGRGLFASWPRRACGCTTSRSQAPRKPARSRSLAHDATTSSAHSTALAHLIAP